MNPKDTTRILQAVAREHVPADINLLPGILAEVEKGNRSKMLRKGKYNPGFRPAWMIALAILVMMIAGTLVIGPQRAYAEIMKLFGYLPDAGFVNLGQVRVLENSVTQRHQGRSLTVVRGLVNEYGTEIWLEFSDGAKPVDDAWLETGDGQRFDLLNWSFSPDEPGTHGVVTRFSPLPPDVNQVTLALPEGWRIPLTWIPGSESSLPPVNIVAAPTLPGGEETANTPAVPALGTPSPCAEAMQIRFCVLAAAQAEDELQVLVEAVPNGQYTPGSTFSLSMFDVPGETAQLYLSVASGQEYPVDANRIQVDGDPTGRLSTLHFPSTQALQGPLSLNIPALLVSIPLSAEIEIDLGENPQPGQTLALDTTVDVAGLPVHFSQATLEGDGSTTLRLKVTSDPLDEGAPLRPYTLDPGRPEGILDRYGAGSGPNNLSLSVELLQPAGLRTGILRIPIAGATLKVLGPFTLTFDAPVGQTEATPEPQVLEGGSFEPLPTGEPLPMDAFEYTGRALQAGDLLAIALGDMQSTFYAASPDAGFTPEKVAILPGQVLEVYPHPDHQGIDYLTGEHEAEAGTTIYRQLYTLRFGDPAPRLLVGQLERSAYNFAWSYDGRFLVYLMSDERPGQDGRPSLRLVDRDCRASGICDPVTVDTSGQDLYWVEWSPNDYRMSAGGAVRVTETFGSNDIFLLSLDTEGRVIALTNLTLSPTINDMPPAHWMPDGNALLYACETGETAINEYSLCRNDLVPGTDEVIVPLLPWNMHSLHLAGDRWLVDRTPVLVNGVYSLRTYDLTSGETGTLLEWPSRGKYWVETSISPDSSWVATIINDLDGLLAMNTQTHQHIAVLPSIERPFFVTWVK